MAAHLGIKICNYLCSFVFSDPDLFTKKVYAGLPGFLFRSRGFAHYFYWLLLLEFLWDTPSKSISITLVKAKNKHTSGKNFKKIKITQPHHTYF